MVLRGIAGGVGALTALGGLAYAASIAVNYRGYGQPRITGRDPLLDPFVPAPEVRERHELPVAAPAPLALDALRTVDLQRSPLVRAIFAARAWVLGAPRQEEPPPGGLVDQVRRLGWGVLREEPGRALVFGAVIRPWEGKPRFRALPPEQFAAFREPGWVKIAWTISAEPLGGGWSTLRTETRVATTDAEARARFRRYWAAAAPGVMAIRRAGLRLARAQAEARMAELSAGGAPGLAPHPG